MSLYNMARGTSISAPICLGILGIDLANVPRFRDAWVSDDGLTITILTRTGGGNRKDYEDEIAAMREYAGFRHDEDDDFDSTFAHFVYDVPERFSEDVRKVSALLIKVGKGASSRGPGSMVSELTGQTAADHGLTHESHEAAEGRVAFERLAATVATEST